VGEQLAVVASKRRSHFSSVDEALAQLGQKFPYKDFVDAALQLYVRHGVKLGSEGVGVTLKCRPEVEAVIYVKIADHVDAVWRGIPSLCCATVIACAGDAAGPHAVLPRAAMELSYEISRKSRGGCAFHRFEGLHHFGPLTAPSVVADHIHNALLPSPQPDSTSRDLLIRSSL